MASLSSGFSVGTGSAPSLIKSAGSLAKAKQDYQDKVAALRWSNSAKTEDDWNEYSTYLNNRINTLSSTGSLSDASKALTLTNTQMSSQRAFTSSAIQRSSIDILEGNASLQDKANAIASFYEMASSNGDMSLAQTLRYQFDQVDQQIQYQQQQAQDLAGKMKARNVLSVGAYVDTLKADLKQFSRQFTDFGAKGLDALSSQYKSSLEATGVKIPSGSNPSIWDISGGVVDNMITSLKQAIDVYGPIDGATLVNDYNKIVNGETKFKVGGLDLSYDDLQDARAAALAGQQWAVPVDSGGKTKLVRNKEQSYMWGKDPTTGQYKIVTGYSPNGPDLGNSGIYRQNAKGEYVDNKGKVIAKKDKFGNVVDVNGKQFQDQASMNRTLDKAEFNYADLLKSAGFNVTNRGGNMYVSGSNQTGSFFKVPGLEQGQEFQVLRGANGQLRFVAPPDETGQTKMYGLSFNGKDNGNLSSFFEVNPLSDMIPGFAGKLNAPDLIKSAQTLQLQVQEQRRVAELEQAKLQEVARLKAIQTTPINTPQIQPAAPVQQAVPVAQVVQPAATVKQIQNAQNTAQNTAGKNVNQQSSSKGITIKGGGGSKGIPL